MIRKLGNEESKVESAKLKSRHLRGTIAETLASDVSHFVKDDAQVLKFHGIYQQDDRDLRHERRKAGLEEAWQFMVRCAIPGGVVTADQYLALDELAASFANGSLRITTRQGFQLHGVIKEKLKATIAGINETLLTTLSACGDVERNVMACPAPLPDEAHRTLRKLARQIAVQLRPATRAYHEIWLDGEKVRSTEPDVRNEPRAQASGDGAELSSTERYRMNEPRAQASGHGARAPSIERYRMNEPRAQASGHGANVVPNEHEEPFYGDQYLPRKFKTGIALADDNCVDVYSYDCGLVALVDGGGIIGFNLLVGGGMGMTHGKEDTIACLAQRLGFVDPPHAVEAVKTVAAIFRDFGNRADRRHARLKYLIAERGMEWFRDEFTARTLFPLRPWRSVPDPVYHDHLGRHAQDNGQRFYGVFIQNGRIADFDGHRVKTALREIISRHRPGIALTPQQNMLLTDLTDSAIDDIEQTLRAHGVAPVTELSAARRYSLACPALPTCGLAMADAERVMPSVVEQFERELASLGVGNEPITLRMTGCPNGCARPYSADIGLVGRRPGIYHVYVGGGLPGDRMADLFAADVHVDKLVETMRPLLADWAANRRPHESLADYYQRLLGREKYRQFITGREEPTGELVHLGVSRCAK